MSTRQEFIAKVAKLQQTLKVPKNNFNKFGGYNFRSAEDILEAVKKVLEGLVLELSEDMVLVGNSVFKKVTASLVSEDGEHRHTSVAFAREADEPPKGMSFAQHSGSVASYGLKYALGRLLLIDDTKDDDATNTHGKEEKPSGVNRKGTPKVEEKVNEEPQDIKEKEEVKPEVNTRPAGGSFRRRGAR
jgi:hypothetical protein